MNAKTAYFNNSKFGESDHTSAIVPLISENKQTGELFFIGTAFYISSSGILMTVKHNLFDKKTICLKTWEYSIFCLTIIISSDQLGK